MAIDEQKYENVILYLIANMRDGMIHGKKKLAKLLYYVDFDRFEYQLSYVVPKLDDGYGLS